MNRNYCAAAFALMASAMPAAAFDNHYMGQLRLVPYTHCPKEWAPAMGQIMSISQHHALFALLGMRFGGDGKTTFALPNLEGPVSGPDQNGGGPVQKEKLHWCIAITGMWPVLH